MNRRGAFTISTELLGRLLGLPAGTTVQEVMGDEDTTEFLLSGAWLPEALLGSKVPPVTVIFTWLDGTEHYGWHLPRYSCEYTEDGVTYSTWADGQAVAVPALPPRPFDERPVVRGTRAEAVDRLVPYVTCGSDGRHLTKAGELMMRRAYAAVLVKVMLGDPLGEDTE